MPIKRIQKLPKLFEDKSEVDKEREELYKEWKSVINMTPAEIKKFYDSPVGKKAGLSQKEASKENISRGRVSAEALMRMIPKGDSFQSATNNWSDTDWKWAGKQVNFHSRFDSKNIKVDQGYKKNAKGERYKLTPLYKALLIWGHKLDNNWGKFIDE